MVSWCTGVHVPLDQRSGKRARNHIEALSAIEAIEARPFQESIRKSLQTLELKCVRTRLGHIRTLNLLIMDLSMEIQPSSTSEVEETVEVRFKHGNRRSFLLSIEYFALKL